MCWGVGTDADPVTLGWEQLHKDKLVGFYRKKRKPMLGSPCNHSMLADPRIAGAVRAYLPVPNSEQFQYLLKGSVSDVRPNTWLKANLDPKQRQLWDPSVRFIRVLPISEKLPQEQRLHWRCKYMWPVSDREYIYARKVHKFPKHNSILTLSKATSVSRLL